MPYIYSKPSAVARSARKVRRGPFKPYVPPVRNDRVVHQPPIADARPDMKGSDRKSKSTRLHIESNIDGSVEVEGTRLLRYGVGKVTNSYIEYLEEEEKKAEEEE